MSQPANPLAIVIGGASGIGSAVAGGLAAEGHRVIVADRNADGAATRVAELGAPHTSAAVDVTDEDTVAALFEQAGPDAGKHVVRRVTFQNDVVDAASVQQLPKQEASRPSADDGYFRPQHPFSLMASACDPQSSYASAKTGYNV